MNTKLTRQTFTTKDSNGCEFRAECYIIREWKHGPIIESHYYGLGIEANSLKELQDKVSKL